MTNNISNNSGRIPRVIRRVQRRNALNLSFNNQNTLPTNILPTNNHNASQDVQRNLNVTAIGEVRALLAIQQRLLRQQQLQQQQLLRQQQQRLARPNSPTSVTEI